MEKFHIKIFLKCCSSYLWKYWSIKSLTVHCYICHGGAFGTLKRTLTHFRSVHSDFILEPGLKYSSARNYYLWVHTHSFHCSVLYVNYCLICGGFWVVKRHNYYYFLKPIMTSLENWFVKRCGNREGTSYRPFWYTCKWWSLPATCSDETARDKAGCKSHWDAGLCLISLLCLNERAALKHNPSHMHE